MTYRQVCKVNNNQVTIILPEDFKGKNQVIVVVDDQVESKVKKMELMKLASSDPLFQLDIKEIQQDFDSIDHETL